MRILLISSNDRLVSALRDALASIGHQLAVVEDGESACRLIQLVNFSVVLLDESTSGMPVTEICGRIRSSSAYKYTYIIFIFEDVFKISRTHGIRPEADDYILKPVQAEILDLRLEIARRVITIEERLHRQKAHLAELDVTDPPAGPRGFRLFEEALDAHFALAQRQQSTLSVILLALDQARGDEDHGGLPFSEEILREVAEILRAGRRSYEMVSRMRGAEFVILLPASGPIVARGVAERLRLAIEGRGWGLISASASFGISTQTGKTPKAATLIAEASEALQQSRCRGGNVVTHHLDLLRSLGSDLPGVWEEDGITPDIGYTGFADAWACPDLEHHLDRGDGDLAETYDSIVDTLSRALNLRDNETADHSQRVTELTIKVARVLEVDSATLRHIRRGALLHDIGKMGVPDMILHKPGPLSDEEWSEMRKHPSLAFEMLEPIVFLRPALEIPYAHHERWDGSGYPRGLKGEQIPLSARAFSVVDVYDALTHDRSYRKAWSSQEALRYIDECSGVQFDPKIVAALHRALASAE